MVMVLVWSWCWCGSGAGVDLVPLGKARLLEQIYPNVVRGR